MNSSSNLPVDKKKIALLIIFILIIFFLYKNMIFKSAVPANPIPENTPVPSPDTIDSGKVTTEESPSQSIESFEKEAVDRSWGRDPFVGNIGTGQTVVNQSKQPNQNEPKDPSTEESPLLLSGIASSRNRALAIINGQIVHEGDYLQVKGKKSFEVISIFKNRVILRKNGKIITLRVGGG